MTAVVILLLLLLGAVFFALGTLNIASRINWVAAGLLCWIITAIIAAAKAF